MDFGAFLQKFLTFTAKFLQMSKKNRNFALEIRLTLIDKTMRKFLFTLVLGASFLCAARAQVIYRNAAYQWRGNQFTQGKMTAKAKSGTEIVSNYTSVWTSAAPNYMPDMPTGINSEHWLLKHDISHLPQYTSSLIIDNALYNMSLEESELAIEPDSTYRTGVYWGGVWTRDVSYSILHSLAQLNPEVSMRSLLAKVNPNNRIIQDTGTGGAWPCSTDRTTWVLAAWECYLVTGSQEWLDRIFPIIRNTIEDDRVAVYDPKTQLMRGETSWLDWREQEYPTWMQPADIYRSECMATTAVHYRALQILAEICRIKGLPTWGERYDSWAADLKEGMNKHLWVEDRGLYAIYLYGRNHLVQHPQMEILGESFAILWDIASPERQRRISEQMVSMDFGTPDFYPNLKDQYPYHNDAMWPFTQGYWMKAQAKAGNEQGVLHAIASIYRLAAMCLSNYENMVIYDGNDKGLPINSPRQLWSVAADIAIVPNIYFGMDYQTDGIHFRPFVPKTLSANRVLKNFRYRNAVLNLHVSGYGNELKSFRLDGKETAPFFAANLTGEHTIEMELTCKQPAAMQMTLRKNVYQPLTPVTAIDGNILSWQAPDVQDIMAEHAAATLNDIDHYLVLHNGLEYMRLPSSERQFSLHEDGEYAVVAVHAEGWRSYMSEPMAYYSHVKLYPVGDYALPFDPERKHVKESAGAGGGLAGKTEERAAEPSLRGVDVSGSLGRIAMITRNENPFISIPVHIETAGTYAIDWRYANGNGPISTDNKCATRLLAVDGNAVGASVFPHRGSGLWNDWGWSNATVVELSAGNHVITLEFGEAVENMNLRVNQALLDVLRITKL